MTSPQAATAAMTGATIALAAVLGGAAVPQGSVLSIPATPKSSAATPREVRGDVGAEDMADAALTKQVQELGRQIEALAQAVNRQSPAEKAAQHPAVKWFADNSAVLSLAIAIVVAAFSFNGRLDKLETNLSTLATHVDSDFRTLIGKIDALSNSVARDEGAASARQAAAPGRHR